MLRIKKHLATRSRRVAAIGAVVALAATGSAVAYYAATESGTDSQSGTVATPATAFTVTDTGGFGSLILGGNTSATFYIANNGSSPLNLQSLNLSVANAGTGGVGVDGCYANWFPVTVTSLTLDGGNIGVSQTPSAVDLSNVSTDQIAFASPQEVGAGDYVTAVVQLSMTDSQSESQNACIGASPTVNLTAN